MSSKFERVLLIALMVVDAGLLAYILLLYYDFSNAGILNSAVIKPNFLISVVLVVIVINVGRFAFLLVWNIIKRRHSEGITVASTHLGE